MSGNRLLFAQLLMAAPLLALPFQAQALSPMATLGHQLFHDPVLSASGQQSCASCHSPENGWTANNKLAVQLGGASLTLQGFRNTPTVAYTRFTPPTRPEDVTNGLARGGFLLDGRATDLAAQAMLPFVAPNEMANATNADVRQRLMIRPYLADFQKIFGTAVLRDADATVKAMARAIAAYEVEDRDFQLFNSKFDAVQRKQAQFTAQEANGARLFNDPAKGNCASCHSSNGINGLPPLFSNFSYHALGLPRNWRIIYNQDQQPLPTYLAANGANLGAPSHLYYDLGACGPFRQDLASQTGLCGKFKVPTLRNAALKGAYGHNGVFNTLQQVVDFYNTRDLQTARWYKKADGNNVDISYNDLPLIYHANIERRPPFAPLPGNRPRLRDNEVRDLVAFICTLTDGFDPKNPAAYRYPPQCHAAAQ